VPFPHPRNRHDPAFRQFVDRIYGLMTRREAPPAVSMAVAAPKPPFSQSLPDLPMNLMAGLMETLAEQPYRGRADLPPLAAALQLAIDELLPLGESLQMLKFAELEEGDIRLTSDGLRFVQGELDERKQILAASLLKNLPMMAAIRQVLDERWNHRARAERFRDELEDHMSPDYARQTLQTVISWGRYAELFDFDEEADQFFLDEDDD